MKKSILAVAVGAALAMAGAAQAEVAISGVAHLSVDSIDDGDTSSLYLSSNTSNIVFQGSEDIEGGLKALWFLQQQIVMDGTGTAVFDMETFAGLSGGFGAIRFGKQDTPMKVMGSRVNFFINQVGDARNLTSDGTQNYRVDLNGDGDYADTVAGEKETDSVKGFGFNARPGNAIQWISPDISGISGRVMYVPEDGTEKSSALGFSLIFNRQDDKGPFWAALAYESHGEALNSSTEEESAIRLAGSYTMGDMKVGALFQTETNLMGSDAYDRTMFGLGGSYKLGAGTVKAQYYSAGDVDCSGTGCGDDTGATLIALGYDHSLSKNTTVYAAYAMVDNKDSAAFTATGAGHGANPSIVFDPATGKSNASSALSFGMITKF